MKALFYSPLVAALLGMAGSAQAQSVGNAYNAPRVDSRMQLSLTIPFGGEERDDYSQPRLELASTRRHSTDFSFQFQPEQQREIRRSFALTLQDQPRFMVDGEFLSQTERRQNISTGEGIAIGLGAVGVFILIATIELSDDLNDLADPD